MKTYFFLIFIFSTFCYSQNESGVAQYEKVASHNFGNMKKLASDIEMKKTFSSVNNSINSMKFELKFNDSIAFYTEYTELKSDLPTEENRLSKVFSGYKGPYSFNFKLKTVTRKKGKYLLEKKYSNYNWKLTKDTVIINNIICYKATTTLKLQGRKGEILRPVVAWYAPSINIPAGPDGFGGLPGLIIQIEVNKVITKLTKINFTDKKVKIEILDQGEKITEKEFAELMKKMSQNRGE